MSTAIDLYATTNPALGSAVLWSFLRGAADAEEMLEFPLLFLPLPILLSSLRDTFEGTNRRTGFYAWLERHPDITVGLAERVVRMQPITQRAVLFGAKTGIIWGAPDARFVATAAVRDAALARAGDAVRPLFPLARRLGAWVGDVGSTRDVLYALGLSV